METITDRIKKTEADYKTKLKNKDNYRKFNNYYNEMKSKGLVKPDCYNFPPIDTIGRRIFQNLKQL